MSGASVEWWEASAGGGVGQSTHEKSTSRRLVCITGMGAGDSKGHGGFVFDRIFNPLMLRNLYVDKDRQESLIRASDLDRIIIRPSVFNPSPPLGEFAL